MKFEDLTKEKLQELLEKSSCYELAERYKVYPNKIRRLAKKLGITPPNRSETQKKLLEQGKVKHPTEGRERTELERERISKGVYENWENMTDAQREEVSKERKERWDKLSYAKKQQMLDKSRKEVRRTSKEGSATEIWLKDELAKVFPLEFHKKGLFNQKLEVDIWIPSLGTAVEVNGPSHYHDIRGLDVLQKQQRADLQKRALLQSNGANLIVVKHIRKPSDEYHRRILSSVLNELKVIKDKGQTKKFTEIEI